ncbi:MAG: hypothetical protein LC723_07140, partial [Actinobacteria bacterium]|nr:hypothetical protein [Actinomycetota bacterium]
MGWAARSSRRLVLAIASAWVATVYVAISPPIAVAIAPSYTNYPAPPASFTTPAGPGGLTFTHSAKAGEPTIGVDRRTGATIYQGGLYTYKVSWSGTTPPVATWSDISPPAALVAYRKSSDAFMYVDPETGRAFVTQLNGDCSVMDYTSNDGATWTHSVLGCGIGSGFDHQSLVGGRYANPAPAHGADYPNNLYYCAQQEAGAGCARSDDGGNTFGVASQMYTTFGSVNPPA